MLTDFTNFQLLAQQDVLSASADATGDGGTVSWSVGQLAYSAWSGDCFNLGAIYYFTGNRKSALEQIMPCRESQKKRDFLEELKK